MVEAQRALLDELMGTGMFPFISKKRLQGRKLMVPLEKSEMEYLF
jgi:hypothetical protein